MAENIQQICWLLGPKTLKAVYVTPAFEDICGRPLDRLDPTSYRTLIHPADADFTFTPPEDARQVDFSVVTGELHTGGSP